MLLMLSFPIMSQPDPGSGNGGPIGGGVPIGGGMVILITMGISYGLTKLYNNHKKGFDE